MKPLLLALDLGLADDALIDVAADFASRLGTPVHVVHVAAPDPDFVGFGAGPGSVRDGVAAELRDEHQRVDDVVSRLVARGIEADGRLLRGATAETLAEEAERVDAAAILVGHHPRTRVAETLMGSTPRELFRIAHRPVFVVPVAD